MNAMPTMTVDVSVSASIEYMNERVKNKQFNGEMKPCYVRV